MDAFLIIVPPHDKLIRLGAYGRRLTMRDTTLEFYDTNAKWFAEGTRGVEFHALQDAFLSCLPAGGDILDFGCGGGRDAKYFLEKGYKVDAVDGSEAMCREAHIYTGLAVRRMLFDELNAEEAYDGIWACASLLHVERRNLPPIFRKMTAALREDGIIYASFKYGTFEGFRGERMYTDFDEASFTVFAGKFVELEIENLWVTGDARPGRGDERWLNVLLKKL